MKEGTADVTFARIRNPYIFKCILQSKIERAIDHFMFKYTSH